MFRNLLRRLGVGKTTVAVTAFSVFVSVFLNLFLSSIFWEISFRGLLFSILIPAIVAPFVSYYFLKLFIQFDRAETALRESEGKYRKLVEQANDDLIVPYLKRTDGPSRIESSHEGSSNPEAKQRYEAILKKRDGTDTCVDVNTGFMNYNGKPASLLFLRDITQTKRAAKSLIECEERFKEMAELLPATIYEMDEKGRLTFINQRAFDDFGYGPRDLERGLSFFDIISPEERQEATEAISTRFKKRNSDLREYTALRKDNSTFPALFHSMVIKHEGKTTGIRGCIIDITDKMKLEAQLRQAHRLEAVGTLAGGVAHDFNNLLQAVYGYTKALLIEKDPSDPDYEKLKGIEQFIKNAKALTRQLLTFGRKVKSELMPMDLNQQVLQIAKILERIIPKMIRVECHFSKNPRIIKADCVQIEQIMMNLGINARDSMSDGGKLIFETANVTLDEEFCKLHPGSRAGDYVMLSVSDTGHGMDQETLHHIFEPFFTTKKADRGTGLGLAMVYGIVKGHGGYIMCRSEPETGTTFKIYLPVMAPEGLSQETVQIEKEDNIPGGTETILLVDDDLNILETGREMLELHGYKVLTAESGEKVLEIFKERRAHVDLVVLDVSMPGMGGCKCLEQLLDMDSKVNVILASGYSVQGQMTDTLGSGAAGFIGKPYQFEDLMKMVRGVIDKKD